jgi:hypothetical protein
MLVQVVCGDVPNFYKGMSLEEAAEIAEVSVEALRGWF